MGFRPFLKQKLSKSQDALDDPKNRFHGLLSQFVLGSARDGFQAMFQYFGDRLHRLGDCGHARNKFLFVVGRLARTRSDNQAAEWSIPFQWHAIALFGFGQHGLRIDESPCHRLFGRRSDQRIEYRPVEDL